MTVRPLLASTLAALLLAPCVSAAAALLRRSCCTGQTHGSVTLPGLPAGAGFTMDPEMMKRMQQLQQRYGR